MGLPEIQVQDVMTTSVVTVGPEESIQEAARRLSGSHISGMPVVAGTKVVGVISERDIIHALTPPVERERAMTLLEFLASPRDSEATPTKVVLVEDVMSRGVTTIPPTASIWEAASAMHRRRVKRLPVTDRDRKLVGIVSRADLIRAIGDGA